MACFREFCSQFEGMAFGLLGFGLKGVKCLISNLYTA